MLEVHQRVEEIRGDPGVSWQESCMRVPVVLTSAVEESMANFLDNDFFGGEESEEDTVGEEGEEADPSIEYYHKGLYCQVVESMPSACLERSLLELWGKVRYQKLPTNLLRRGISPKMQSLIL